MTANQPNMKLCDATVQEIELELIRRRRFNEFDGPKIVESFERNPKLWIAAYMDRFGLYRDEHPDWLPASSLIKLRDLRHNRWNVDTLCVLTPDIDHARELAALADMDDWQADEVIVQDNAEEVSMALGMFPLKYGLVTFWWD